MHRSSAWAAVLALLGISLLQAQPTLVPPEYADLYGLLENKLQTAENYLSTHWDDTKHSVVFSTELLAANSNQGERVLTEQAWQSILFNLDRIQFLGVRAVKVAVKYPILVPQFPRSAEYLALYKKLGDELRRRNLKFLVQMTPGFKPSALSALPVEPYYATLTLERYKHERRQMAELMIDHDVGVTVTQTYKLKRVDSDYFEED